MPRRQLPGGENPFPVQSRPSIFNPLPPEEVIERHGEPALWIREIPTPFTGKNKMAMPDSKADAKGFIHTFQKEQRVEIELAQIQAIRGRKIYTQLTPVSAVHRVYIQQDKLRGGDQDLTVKSFCDNFIEIAEDVEYWRNVFLEYSVLMHRKAEFLFCNHETSKVLRPPFYPQYIIKVMRVLRQRPGEPGFTEIPMDQIQYNFTTITVPEVAPVDTKYRIKAEVYEPIPIGYRTVDTRLDFSRTINFEMGDLEVVVSPYFHFSEGDIVILTKLKHPEKEIVDRGADGLYRLKKTPIAEILSVHTGDGELSLDLCKTQGYQRFAINMPYPPERVVVTYLFNPTFRIHKQLSASALNNRVQPKKWLFKPDFTTAILE